MKASLTGFRKRGALRKIGKRKRPETLSSGRSYSYAIRILNGQCETATNSGECIND
jgi:hypothetical protein